MKTEDEIRELFTTGLPDVIEKRREEDRFVNRDTELAWRYYLAGFRKAEETAFSHIPKAGDWEIPTPVPPPAKKYWRCPDCGHRATTVTRQGALQSINALIRRECGTEPLCRHGNLKEEMQNPDGTRSTFDDVDE